MSDEQLRNAHNDAILEDYIADAAVRGALPTGHDLATLKQRIPVDIDSDEIKRNVAAILQETVVNTTTAKARSFADSITDDRLLDPRHARRVDRRSSTIKVVSSSEAPSGSSVQDRQEALESRLSQVSAQESKILDRLDTMNELFKAQEEANQLLLEEIHRQADLSNHLLGEIARLTEAADESAKQARRNQETIGSLTISLTKVMEEFMTTRAYIADMALRGTLPAQPVMSNPVALGQAPLSIPTAQPTQVEKPDYVAKPVAPAAAQPNRSGPSKPKRR